MPNLADLIRASIEAMNRMPQEEREAMLRDQCKPRNPFDGRSTEDLEAELAEVEDRAAKAHGWGASLAALAEWQQDLKRELRRLRP